MELTKEEQIQAIYDLKVGYTLGHADIAMLKAMARQLLAVMGQEPVYFINKVTYKDSYGDDVELKAYCSQLDAMKSKADFGGTVIPLYAAPQLPQPAAVVSDEVIDTFEAEFRWAFEVSAGVEQLIEIGYQGEKFSLSIRDAATWWKLGRAAILKHSAPFIVTSDHRMMEMPQVEDINAVAAMLQGAEPVATVYKLPFEQWLSKQTGTIDVECGCVMTEVFYHWLRVAYEAGNSPVIHDGWVTVPVDMTPEQMCAVQLNSELGAYAAANFTGAYSLFREFWDVAIAAAPDFRETAEMSTNTQMPSPIDHGYRPDCECSGCIATARICAELSVNSPVIPECWCLTCRPVTMTDMRFVVCPDCGNKRCPHANDHRNACTGSNEPGQEGSAYPAAPQQEVDNG